MKRCTCLIATCLLSLAMGVCTTHAQQTLYWDIDGANPGAGGSSPSGSWNTTDTNWSTDPAGAAAPTAYVVGDHVIFSAGTDATGPYGITADATVGQVGSLTVDDGRVIFSGTPIALGTAPSRVNQGAVLQIPGISQMTISAGQVMTLDGGTIRNTIVGVGSGTWSGSGTIELTSNGGTFDVSNGSLGQYSIMSYTGTINLAAGATTATLVKKGSAEQRLRNNHAFTTLDVQGGLVRVDGTGGTDLSLGAANGTVITHGGAVSGTTSGTALGTSITITSPATRSFVLNNDQGPDTMFITNASWTINGPVSGPGGILLNGWVRADTNAVIGSSGPDFTLAGANTYAGNTSIAFGRLVAAGGSAIPDTSRVDISSNSTYGTTVTENARLQLNNSETVGSLSGGSATRGMVRITASTTTFTVGADGTSTTYDGGFAGNGNLTKIGSGTLTLTRPFSAADVNVLTGNPGYAGNTTVQGGTLSFANPILSDTGDVLLNTGSILDLTFAGADAVNALFINGTQQAAGTWGGVGSGAANITALITGTGLLNVTASPPVTNDADFNGDGTIDSADYVVWRKFNPATGTGTQGTGDANGDTNINAADEAIWQQTFGQASPGGGGSGAVPEPTSAVMLMLGLAALASRRRG